MAFPLQLVIYVIQVPTEVSTKKARWLPQCTSPKWQQKLHT